MSFDQGRAQVIKVDDARNVVIRRYGSGWRLQSEMARMTAGRAIAARTGLFRVPAIVDVDESAKCLIIEQIGDFRSISSLGMRGPTIPCVVRAAGLALAAIHSGSWSYTDAHDVPLFHGDFDVHNVGVDAEERLVVLDWDPAPGLSGLALTEQQKDVGLLQFSLVATSLTGGAGPHRIRGLVEQFLDSYAVGSGRPRAPGELLGYALAVSRESVRICNIPRVSPIRRAYYWVVRRATQGILAAIGGTIQNRS